MVSIYSSSEDNTPDTLDRTTRSVFWLPELCTGITRRLPGAGHELDGRPVQLDDLSRADSRRVS